ncbi:unnamed protein product [Caenorhabditis auriculariae]|uniref:Uncharacterized protein n=1 Tax=Caenorhabditis auriculariae TaxID=2777116 RepID=A0A8S1HMK9_9PELO|nr:unnamed protein product [Caenorhabditis auriculariae]
MKLVGDELVLITLPDGTQIKWSSKLQELAEYAASHRTNITSDHVELLSIISPDEVARLASSEPKKRVPAGRRSTRMDENGEYGESTRKRKKLNDAVKMEIDEDCDNDIDEIDEATEVAMEAVRRRQNKALVCKFCKSSAMRVVDPKNPELNLRVLECMNMDCLATHSLTILAGGSVFGVNEVNEVLRTRQRETIPPLTKDRNGFTVMTIKSQNKPVRLI